MPPSSSSATPDYLRVAAAVPTVHPVGFADNLASVKRLIVAAEAKGVQAVVFPELCLTGYTCADLFYRPDVLGAAEASLKDLIVFTRDRPLVVVVGLPVRIGGRLFNCAAVLAKGLCGVVPKTYLPSTHEFYESRWFASALEADVTEVTLAGATVPFGNDLVFSLPGTRAVFGVELCEDMWAANPPSTRLALHGANVILNLSGSNELIGKADYRRGLVLGQSARTMTGYVYAGAGVGESTTDLVFGGHTLIAENGTILSEGERFLRTEHLTCADLDLDFLDFERSANCAFRTAVSTVPPVRRIVLPVSVPVFDPEKGLLRPIDPHPFVPSNAADRTVRCEEILAIQSTGLATRLDALQCSTVVLGLSGGLDSALALLVAVEAFDRLKLPRSGIRVLTLPGFGTTARTKGNAEALCRELGVPLETIDIKPMARQHLKDLGHDEAVHDITYENTQARGRTYLLMDKANQLGGLVLGTGDLSELALGWCTYNGDHMSMYGVNAGVPKTLVRYVIETYAQRHPELAALSDILATPVSPELLPANADGTIAQVTEDQVGPYELHDFFLYHFLRRGASYDKLRCLAELAFADTYHHPPRVRKWLEVFFRRFYAQQFKRSCLPDGPKVGSVNLSPRGDWRMPSDVRGGNVSRGHHISL